MFVFKPLPSTAAGATMLVLSALAAFAQANGDPGAAMGGQVAAQHAKAARHNSGDQESGANAMSKGSSGGEGGSATTGGSNAASGSGSLSPKP